MRRRRVPLDAFLRELDRDLAVKLLADVQHKIENAPTSCALEKETLSDCPRAPAHQSCPKCWRWNDCGDPLCDHPACGHRHAGLFRDAWREAVTDEWIDVFVSRGEPQPLAEYARMPELVLQEKADAVMGGKILAGLQRANGWCQLHDLRIGGDASLYLNGEVWLAQQGVPIEVSWAAYDVGFWVALAVAEGEEIVGHHLVSEFRLSRALDLSELPVESQGALF